MDYIIILCAGNASRAALNDNKIFYPVGNGTVLSKAIDCFTGLGHIILVAAKSDKKKIEQLHPSLTVVEGGNTRTKSVRNALSYIHSLNSNPVDFNNKSDSTANGTSYPSDNIPNKESIALIHDCARPFASPDLIKEAIISAKNHGSGIPSVKPIDTIVKAKNSKIENHLEKEELFIIQTPQCFNYLQIKDAYDRVEGDYPDDSAVYKKAGYSPTLTNGDYKNKKLTLSQDFVALNPCMAAGAMDFHQLVEGRRLVLGGITIPYEKGLLGHSDADVVTHAIIDSVLEAAGKPDIGVLFPDTDPAYKDIDSLILLDKAMEHLKENGREILSVSCTIMAQKPKLAPFIPKIRENLAKKLNIGMNFMLIHATTTEFLGVVGKGKGIAANAMILYKQVAPLKITGTNNADEQYKNLDIKP